MDHRPEVPWARILASASAHPALTGGRLSTLPTVHTVRPMAQPMAQREQDGCLKPWLKGLGPCLLCPCLQLVLVHHGKGCGPAGLDLASGQMDRNCKTWNLQDQLAHHG